MIQPHHIVTRLLALSALFTLFLGSAACDSPAINEPTFTMPGQQDWTFPEEASSADSGVKVFPEWGPTSPTETITGIQFVIPAEPTKTTPEASVEMTPEMVAVIANLAQNVPLDGIDTASEQEHLKVVIPQAPFCGDGVCNRDEDGISCLADCDGEPGVLCATDDNEHAAMNKDYYPSDSYFDCDGVCRKENVWPTATCESAYNCAIFNYDDGNCAN